MPKKAVLPGLGGDSKFLGTFMPKKAVLPGLGGDSKFLGTFMTSTSKWVNCGFKETASTWKPAEGSVFNPSDRNRVPALRINRILESQMVSYGGFLRIRNRNGVRSDVDIPAIAVIASVYFFPIWDSY